MHMLLPFYNIEKEKKQKKNKILRKHKIKIDTYIDLSYMFRFYKLCEGRYLIFWKKIE